MLTGVDPALRRLTPEQRVASASRLRNVFIEAEPGSGKTTVAAQRFGVLRFVRRCRTSPAVLAVSFTRSATAELRNRVMRGWGPSAVQWPHRISTIDFLMRRLLTSLLTSGHIEWLRGQTELEVVDSWRSVTHVAWHRTETYLELVERKVVVSSRQTLRRGLRPATDAVQSHVSEGVCTHDDVRSVLANAVEDPELAEVIRAHLASSVRSLIVDEVFDANKLDLAIVEFAMTAGVEATIIGDPWQALYGFRGARPDDVPDLVARTHMRRLPLTASFRWETEEQLQLADALRDGTGIVLTRGAVADADVVLASRWRYLWEVGHDVLPLAFAPGDNDEGKAAETLLLNQVTRNAFQLDAASLGESMKVLGLHDRVAVLELEPALNGLVEALQSSAPDAVRTTFALLSDLLQNQVGRPLGSPVHDDMLRLAALRDRLLGSALTPGLTTHQAKGREWNRVGIRLDADETRDLRGGLVSTRESDRKTYVACTRARRHTFAV